MARSRHVSGGPEERGKRSDAQRAIPLHRNNVEAVHGGTSLEVARQRPAGGARCGRQADLQLHVATGVRSAIQRSRNFVSNCPETNSSVWISSSRKGIVVWTPSITKESSARRARAIASARVLP